MADQDKKIKVPELEEMLGDLSDVEGLDCLWSAFLLAVRVPGLLTPGEAEIVMANQGNPAWGEIDDIDDIEEKKDD